MSYLTETGRGHALAIIIALLPGCLTVGSVRAEGTISTYGVASVERKPERMRMQFTISVYGRGAREALVALRAKQELLRGELTKIGASADSIRFEQATFVVMDQQRRRELEQYGELRRTSRIPQPRPTTRPVAPTVVAAARVVCDWPLKGETTDDIFVEAAEYQNAATKLKLSSPSIRPGMTDEEREAAEERGSGVEEQMAGLFVSPPDYAYVARIPENERLKATAQACEKARQDAERLAKAMNTQIGSLQNASYSSSGTAADYIRPYRRPYLLSEDEPRFHEDAMEEDGAVIVLGNQPTRVLYRIAVNMVFAIKPGQ